MERLREGLHRHGAVADRVDEPLLVGAGVGQRSVQVSRREHRFRQFGRRRRVGFRFQDRVGPGAILGRALCHQGELAKRQNQNGREARQPFRHVSSVVPC